MNYLLGLTAACSLCLASAGTALETSAGADTVNTSQVGINAKIDASNSMLETGINSINACGKTGKIYDSVHNTCITVVTSETDPLATPKLNNILACGDANKIAHSNGSCSSAMPTDVSAQVNNIIACNAQGKLWNGTACAAVGGAGGTFTVNRNDCDNWPIGGKGQTVWCTGNRVLVGVTSYGIETGKKTWDARFSCCSVKIQ